MWLDGTELITASPELVSEFQAWANRVGAEHAYTVRFLPVGTEDPEVGPPTQMAVFSQ